MASRAPLPPLHCSEGLFAQAQSYIPGGVNSPVRAFKSVGGTPRFIRSAEGPYLNDADGNQYIDYVGSWGPMILGHCSAVVENAIREAVSDGVSFGAPTGREVEFAELLSSIIPSVELLRCVNSGTEATMTAIRVARGFTGRDKLLKFNGCYHGHADAFLVAAGSGVATCGIAGSPGIPESVVEQTVSIQYNNSSLFDETLEAVGPESLAAVIVEPVAGNMGLVIPELSFLEHLAERCKEHGIVLIFDEVMSGFRVGLEGAIGRFGVVPDLVTYGKVVGGGLPCAVLGGRREVMSQLAPSGPVYQAGTLSGNPLAMAAGTAVLKTLKSENPFPMLEERAKAWAEGMNQAAEQHGIPFSAYSCGSMLGLCFSEEPPRNFEEVGRSDIELFKKFFHLMLEEGVYLAPSAYEAGFLSVVHDMSIIERTHRAAERAFTKLSQDIA